jgi:hypothetical protein
MRFRDGLYRARGHIAFLIGLFASFAIILSLEGLEAQPGSAATPVASSDVDAALPELLEAARSAPEPSPGPLRPDQLQWGRIAWSYFKRNLYPETGLPGSVDGFPSATAWEIGSYLNALVSAQAVGIIEAGEFDRLAPAALGALGRLPLFEGALPNKSYDVRTLGMTDYNGQPSATGIGWSGLDVARLLLALNIMARRHPEHAAAVDTVVRRWQLDRLLAGGVLMGRSLEVPDVHQEGRLGYEEYAAKGLVRLGLDAYRALETTDTISLVEISGIHVPIDDRDRERHDADVCTTSEPYILEGLELGFDARSRAFAWAVLRAQEQRATSSGIPTAVSEDHVEGPPYFVYGCVVGNGVPWAVLSPGGERFDQLRFLDTKAVFGWSALFPTPYTEGLLQQVFPLNDPERGWYAGRFEVDRRINGAVTANANAVILESLHYRMNGPLLPRGISKQ